MTLDALGLTPEQADSLLKLVAKKLGLAPEELAARIAQGQYDAILSTPQAKKVIQGMAKGEGRGGG